MNEIIYLRWLRLSRLLQSLLPQFTLSSLSQNCATGLTSDGKTPKTLVEEMVPLLDNKDIRFCKFLTLHSSFLRIPQQCKQGSDYCVIYSISRRGARGRSSQAISARSTARGGSGCNQWAYTHGSSFNPCQSSNKSLESRSRLSLALQNPTDRDPKKKTRDKSQAIDDDYELSRFRPALKSILEVRTHSGGLG